MGIAALIKITFVGIMDPHRLPATPSKMARVSVKAPSLETPLGRILTTWMDSSYSDDLMQFTANECYH